MFQIVEQSIDLPSIREDMISPEAGAVITFEGRVRNKNNEKEVTALAYSTYPELAENVADELIDEATERYKIEDVTIIQRTGYLPVTECSTIIAVSAAHRKPAFRGCEWLIDNAKKRLPVWKKEIYEDGTEVWINTPDSKQS